MNANPSHAVLAYYAAFGAHSMPDAETIARAQAGTAFHAALEAQIVDGAAR